jgi:FtsZ-interacting cell division protein YlmF
MGFFDRIMKGIDYDRADNSSDFMSRPKPLSNKKFSGYNSKEYYENESRRASNFLMFAPNSFDDVEIIIDHLKNHEAVIINLKEIKSITGQRVLDFISGAIYALDGSIQPIENGLFLLTPGGVNIMQKKD